VYFQLNYPYSIGRSEFSAAEEYRIWSRAFEFPGGAMFWWQAMATLMLFVYATTFLEQCTMLSEEQEARWVYPVGWVFVLFSFLVFIKAGAFSQMF
jgi:hypothetical protein